MKRFIIIGLLIICIRCSINLEAQNKTITYIADTFSIFPNPERGWYYSYTPPCCDKAPTLINGPHDPLILDNLLSLRNLPEAVTVIRDIVKIQLWAGDIPQARLDEIQTDLNTVRQAGLKVVWRICYNYSITTGEAPASVISRHLDQLKTIIQNNSDVIFDVQAGLFGGSGEACCQSYLIHRNNNNWSSLDTDAIALYNKLISYVLADRSIVVRYPRYKYQMMGWVNSAEQAITDFPSAAVPLNETNAFDGSLQSRLGFMQDNFAGDENGYGFFNAWGKSDRDFTAADTRYALMEGELSASTPYNQQNGVAEMQKYHFTAFHGIGNYKDSYGGWLGVSFAWKANGQYDVIGRKLGYRFRLIDATVPNTLIKDGTFKLTMNMANDGWARIMNPRKVEIIFRNKTTGAKFVIDIDGDGRGNRLWLPGPGETKTLNISQALPPGIPTGQYDLFLNLPDPYPSIHDRPEYSIRLANKDIWEAATGFNSLLCVTKILN